MRIEQVPRVPEDGSAASSSGRSRPRNVEPLDRFLRIAVGAELLAAVVVFSGEWRWLGLAGVLPLLSGLAGWCPVYAWLSRD